MAHIKISSRAKVDTDVVSRLRGNDGSGVRRVIHTLQHQIRGMPVENTPKPLTTSTNVMLTKVGIHARR